MEDFGDVYMEDDDSQMNLLSRLLGAADLADEELLMEMSVVECDDLRDMVLGKLKQQEPDAFHKLLNFILRLAQSNDEMVNCFVDHNSSLFTFVFDVVAAKFKDMCTFSMKDYEEFRFSDYDYGCSVLITFVSTFNDQQIQELILTLLENMLSPVFIKSLMAADILLFTCRFAGEEFSFNIFEVAFGLLDEIYFQNAENVEDVEIAYVYAQQIQNVLISFLDRLVLYLTEEQLRSLIQKFPNESYFYLYNTLNCSLLNPSPSQSSITVNFLNHFKTKDDFYLANVMTHLNTRYPFKDMQTSELLLLLKCLQKVWQTNMPLPSRFTFKTLSILDAISSNRSVGESDGQEVATTICDIFGNLIKHCLINFILCQQLFVTILNLTCQGSIPMSFINTLAASNLQFKKNFKRFLIFYKRQKSIKNEERELYIGVQSTKYLNIAAMDSNQLLYLDS